MICSYCGVRRAVNADHVVPRSLRKKRLSTHPGQCPCTRCASRRADIPTELFETVPACFECNNGKGARRLVPASWARRLPLLELYFPGKPWTVWRGEPEVLRETHLHRAPVGAESFPSAVRNARGESEEAGGLLIEGRE